MNKVLFVAVVLCVAGVVGLGVALVGGPGLARLEVQDRERIQDLFKFAGHLQCSDPAQVLPETLDAPEYCGGRLPPRDLTDPVSQEPYIYRKLSDDQFEVCARFATPSIDNATDFAAQALRFDGDTGCLRYVRSSDRTGWTQN